ncbi:MAG: amidase [Mongoliibacter sp.]|uniref:N-acetylmuramoyl-L-alanine amidase n=1 Tax=Mongoliibacter sp. TaxID=2022438 RepID=UPI0012F26388|nr:SH3 domain-containing protein [Mongoliibacter sp.]TVP49987.1 MAG: amidase [Mongoliibacter sp.]
METKFGFAKMTIEEFTEWLSKQRVARTILNVQQHHTWIPNYSHFNGKNHFERQQAMKNHHVGVNGWADIGQHFSVFPDGAIVSGRSLERVPACITGHNAHSICLEHVGNFDKDGDTMTEPQRNAIIKMTAAICKKFNLPVNTNSIIYHHWFELGTGLRNNGSRNNKSCPGTAFFGGNKVDNCEETFLPLVREQLGDFDVVKTKNPYINYVLVTASRLNVRTQPNGRSSLANNRSPIELGAILRVYGKTDGWLKISNSQDHWVSGRFTKEVKRATVNASVLRVRSGPGTNFNVEGNLNRGEEVFIVAEKNGWCKIGFEEKWLSSDFLDFH